MNAYPGRVLVVDNDPHFRDSVQVLLGANGYTVFAASTPAEARRIAKTERVHVAILDIRMESDPDRDDRSGLELAGKLDPLIVKIMLSGYADPRVVRSSFGEVSAFTFVEKEECPDRLLRELSRAFAEEVKINFDLSIRWQGIHLEEVAREIELKDEISSAVAEAEVEELLRKLFHQADEILVTPLIPVHQARSTSQSGAVLLKVERRYRDSGRGAPVVVKLAARDKIAVEAGNYEQYVDGLIGGFRHTRLYSKVHTHLLGGIIYTLVGAPLEECVDLGTFYAEHPADQVIQVLESLFTQTCHHWYANRQARQTHDLIELYAKPLKLSADRLEAVLHEIGMSKGTRERQRIPGLKANIPDPIEWLREHPQLPTQASLCYTHGDLHSRNVLVDRNQQAWLIDFYRTGPGHIFRDLIEMECDVKFVMLDTTDLPGLLRFEAALLSASQFGDAPTLPRLQGPELRKAFVVVLGIRQIASGLAGPEADMLDYYQGLMLQSLAMIRLRHVPRLKKRHAYLAASLLRQRLETWRNN